MQAITRESGASKLQRGVPVGEKPEALPDLEGPIIGQTFREFRLWHGLTQADMAAQVGAHLATYMAWETGRRRSAVSEQAVRNMLYGLHCRLRHAAHYRKRANGAR